MINSLWNHRIPFWLLHGNYIFFNLSVMKPSLAVTNAVKSFVWLMNDKFWDSTPVLLFWEGACWRMFLGWTLDFLFFVEIDLAKRRPPSLLSCKRFGSLLVNSLCIVGGLSGCFYLWIQMNRNCADRIYNWRRVGFDYFYCCSSTVYTINIRSNCSSAWKIEWILFLTYEDSCLNDFTLLPDACIYGESTCSVKITCRSIEHRIWIWR